MRDEVAEVIKLTPSEAVALAHDARMGEAGSVRKFLLYSAWRQIRQDKLIPEKNKLRVLRELAGTVEIEIAPNGR